MAQESGKSRPVHLTDAQVKELAGGRSVGFGEQSRPRALTAQDVEALHHGKHVNLEKLPALALQPMAHYEGGATGGPTETRPRAITDKDVEALRKGTDIGLEKREPLKRQ